MSFKNRVKIIKSILRHPIKYYYANREMPNNKSDLKRWENVDNLHQEWDERTIMMAKLIPASSSVLEFGAGRLILRDHLNENCIYQPSDIVDRGENTIVCDLNDGYPLLESQYSHIVFSGVLEYLVDIKATIQKIKEHNNNSIVITSYAITDKTSDFVTRRENGWINHLNNKELIDVFDSCGFELVKSFNWKLQAIYVFK